MKNESELKALVKEKYGGIASQAGLPDKSSCCGNVSDNCTEDLCHIMADDYSKLEGYNPDADLGLGCGLPTEFAKIKTGDTVVDLGSGAGNDCFIALSAVGPSGKVIGIDFTEKMIEKARQNAQKLQYNNVEFRLGDIEDIPITSNKADVIVSNCVLNLVYNKYKVFSEIYRVLKPGGHFSISDIVLQGQLPEKLKQAAKMYAGCVSGAVQKDEYLSIIEEAGFINISLQKEKKIFVPDEILLQFLSKAELDGLRQTNPGIYSITVYAEKPAKDERNCCGPESSCC
jgi:SAM-dependent methyltransferase